MEKTKTRPAKWNDRYAIYVIANGVEKRKTREVILGLCSDLTRADAEEKLRGIIRTEVKEASTGGLTLWEFLIKAHTGYIACRAPAWKPKWKMVLESLYDCHFKDSIAAKKLKDITRADCQAWLNSKAPLSKSMIHKCRTQLSAILQEAYAQDLVEKNRAQDLTMPESKTPTLETPFLLKSQVAHGLKLTSGYADKREYLILKLAATRGLRPNEICALRVNDIQGNQLMVDEGVVEGIAGDPKTKGSKAPVALTEEFRLELEACVASRSLSGDQFLFTYKTGNPISQNITCVVS